MIVSEGDLSRLHTTTITKTLQELSDIATSNTQCASHLTGPHSRCINLQWPSRSYNSFILGLKIPRARSRDSAEDRWPNHTPTPGALHSKTSEYEGQIEDCKVVVPEIGSCRTSNWTDTLLLRTTSFSNKQFLCSIKQRM